LEYTVPGTRDKISKLTFCSIATPSHVGQSSACLESIRLHHADASYFLLLVNASRRSMRLTAGIRVLHIEDCIDAVQLRAMRKSYTNAELCFAAKPFLIAQLFAAGAEQVHYLDGDCQVVGTMAPLISDLASADLLLTPHSFSPMPEDGCTPRSLTLLRAGVFNAGYIGVRNTAEGITFVSWLSSMTAKYARNAPKEGMCGDQKWLDLAPVLFPGTLICRHPGANVAYWNLHERQLSLGATGRFLVNGLPLIFFHFSGYTPQQPSQLSMHQNRHSLIPGTALYALVEQYRPLLAAVAGPAKTQGYLRKALAQLAPLQSVSSRNSTERKE
jgi:hypothetical protein